MAAAVSEGRADTYIVVAGRLMDAESVSFAKELYAAIAASGWPCSFSEMSTHSFPGVAIYYNPEKDARPGLALVMAVANAAQVKFTTEFKKVEQIPIQHAPCIYVVVGYKE